MKISRTKQLIADTLKACVAEIPFKKVTVQILCDRCKVNRGTFYYHFKDISDLVCWIYHTEVTVATRSMVWYEAQDGQFPYGLDKMYANRDFYCQAWDCLGQNNLRDFAATEFKYSFSMIWEDYLRSTERQPKPGYNIDDILHYFAQAHYYTISDWVSSGMKMPIEQLSKLLYTVSYTGIMAALHEASLPDL